MIARKAVVGMPFVITTQPPILPKNALANTVICRPIPIAFDAHEMDTGRHEPFLKTAAASAALPKSP